MDKNLGNSEVKKILEDFSEESLTDFSSGSDNDYEPSASSTSDNNECYEEQFVVVEKFVELENVIPPEEIIEPEDIIEHVNNENEDTNNTDLPENVRKRKRNENQWIQNQRKFKRNTGQEYKTRTGKLIKSKPPKSCICNCKLKCYEKFPQDVRININRSFWELSNYGKQRMFINHTVLLKTCKRKLTRESRRNFTFSYNLNGEQVCKKFYLATLNISDAMVMTVKNKEKQKKPVDRDNRGSTRNAKKIDAALEDTVRDHIKCFPCVESHYTRKNSKKMYLASDLNIKKMYDLYKEKYAENKLSEHTYRRIFNSEFNLSFHVPKKDACRKCEQYKNVIDKSSLEDEYMQHIKNKNSARTEKEKNNIEAEKNDKIKVYTFDLQSVLYAPCSNVSSFYYTRKFASYNLTFYDLVTKQGFCNFWMETDGGRGSDEVGSILFKHLQSIPITTKHVILFSDCCGGQNRNRYIAALLAHCNRVLHFQTIELKYLESGHTQMEVDSMHSAIGKAKKGLAIYSPTEWPTILRMARRRNPYVVHELKFSDFYDLKDLFNRFQHDLHHNSNGEKISWLKVKILKVSKSNLNIIEYKTDWEDNFYTIDLTQIKKRRSVNVNNVNTVLQLNEKYTKQLEINKAKKKDLLSLCREELLPPNALEFYENLPEKDSLNRLDEPNFSEDDFE